MPAGTGKPQDVEMGRFTPRFRDRRDAGRQLAAQALDYAGLPGVLVLALPRGGAPVGYEVARALHAPLDVFLVRKLGVPGHEELAMGAIATGDIRVLNPDVVEGRRIPASVIDQVAKMERRELQRREHAYRDDLPPPQVSGKVVILVDDGLATGATMRAALLALREEHPAKLVVAVPVAPPSTDQDLHALADDVVCVQTPDPFDGVGRWYKDFAPTSDNEVRHLLQLSREETSDPPSAGEPAHSEQDPAPGAH